MPNICLPENMKATKDPVVFFNHLSKLKDTDDNHIFTKYLSIAKF